MTTTIKGLLKAIFAPHDGSADEVDKVLTTDDDMPSAWEDGLGIQTPAYGELSIEGNSTGTGAFAGAGEANKKQVAFDTAGVSSGTTPDATENHITVPTAGDYQVNFSLSMSGAANDVVAWRVYKNGGVTSTTAMGTRKVGSGGDVGRAACQGIVTCAANDTLEVWIWNESDTSEVVVEDAVLTCVRLGS